MENPNRQLKIGEGLTIPKNQNNTKEYATKGNYEELRKLFFQVRAYFKVYERTKGKSGINYRQLKNVEIEFIRNCIAENSEWSPVEAAQLWTILKGIESGIISNGLALPEKPKLPKTAKPASLGYVRYVSGSFEIRINKNPEVLKDFKKMVDFTGREFDKTSRLWTVAMSQSNSLHAFTQKHRGFRIGEIATRMMSDHDKSLKQSYSYERVDLEHVFKDGLLLRDYQTVGVDYEVRKRSILNGDDMGLGKTVQSIAGKEIINEFPVLICCPKSLIYNWYNEIKKWSDRKPFICDHSNMKKFLSYVHYGKADYVIVNHHGLKTHFVKSLTKNRYTGQIEVELKDIAKVFKCIVIDEVHYFKNPKTQLHQTALKISSGINNRQLLTGTPIVNDVKDLWPLISLLGREKDFGGYAKFMEDYKKAKKKSIGRRLSKEPLEILNDMLRSICMVRREKKQVLSELPDKSITEVCFDIDNYREYKDCYNNFHEYLKRHKGRQAAESALNAERLTLLNELTQIAARGKAEQAGEFIENLMLNDKVVVFAWYKDSLRRLKKRFPEMLIIDGGMDAKERQANVEKFQNDPRYKIIGLTYGAGGVGYTLTASSTYVGYGLGWSPKDLRQAEDRLWRMGQKNNVMCYYLLANNTVDQLRYNIIKRKASIIQKGIDSKEKFNTVQAELIDLLMKGRLRAA